MLHRILRLPIATKDDPRSGGPTMVVTEEMVKKSKRFLAGHRITVRFAAEKTKLLTGSVHSILHKRLRMKKLKWNMKGQRFKDDEAVVGAVQEFLSAHDEKLIGAHRYPAFDSDFGLDQRTFRLHSQSKFCF
ncbi:hypothetical protein EVAR_96121_1 [Eumeta japonica]|uniref:Uncharacterized protein n=1 Tax=Eumeta variegata TaxID=151549 RepID=A0A4C1VFV8_EUMVA|nr:hypothetical protein EVAR_96121_1 [Eumeta japonica]